jgi:solute carrier family 13 (sodium-dependent dicarboxylate transporter), member 2/3/5
VAKERRKLGTLSRGEKNTLLVLGLALIGWFLPGLVRLVAGDGSTAYTEVSEASNEGIVAILAAGLLFVLPVDWARRKFTLTWNQASQIDWGTVILFGGGLVLGTLLSETGLAAVFGESISDSLGVSSLVGITIVIVILAVLVSNAIVYSSGLLPITRMVKAGAVFGIIGAVLCVVGVIAMANLVGLA